MPKYKHGSGSVYKRGKTWWLTYYANGRQVWESAKTKDKAEARKLLQAKIGQRAEGRLMVGADKLTFEDLLTMVENEYKANERKTLNKVQGRGRHLARSFAGCRALDITTDALWVFIIKRQEEGASNGEVNRELSTLRRGFNLALRAQKIPHMPYFPRLEESAP